MSPESEENRPSTLDRALTLGRAVRAENGGKRLFLSAGYGDQMLVIVDSSEVAAKFTVGVFITTLFAARRWFFGVFSPWNEQRRFPNERLAYKKYKTEGSRLDDLREFMLVADQCPGLLLSVYSPDLSQRIVTSDGDTQSQPELSAFRNWSQPEFERLMRTSCAIAIGMEQFYCHPERWTLLHDTDQLFEPSRRETSLLWICSFVSLVRGRETTPMILHTKEEVENPLVAKALLGISDIAAGGCGSGLSSWNEKYGIAQNQSVGQPGDLHSKDRAIATWFGQGVKHLHKYIVSFGDDTEFGYVHQIGLHLTESSPANLPK